MVDAALFSTNTGEWETPQDLFDELNNKYKFTLDAAASKTNAKCKKYYTKEKDALTRSWGGRVWINPPYGRGVSEWVKKADMEFKRHHANLIVMLLPARTDTKWFHEFIWDTINQKPRYYITVHFIKGRLRFGGAKNTAPFPSMIIIWERKE